MERLYSHAQHLETNRLFYNFGLSILAFEGKEAEVDPSCLPFTISSRKIGLKSKWNITFWVVRAESLQ